MRVFKVFTSKHSDFHINCSHILAQVHQEALILQRLASQQHNLILCLIAFPLGNQCLKTDKMILTVLQARDSIVTAKRGIQIFFFFSPQEHVHTCRYTTIQQSLRKLQDCLTKLANFHSVLQKISVCLTNVLWFLTKRDSNLLTDKPPVLHLLERFHEDCHTGVILEGDLGEKVSLSWLTSILSWGRSENV